MGDKTGIGWTDSTWNPVRGCTRMSEGCRHCYAEGIAARFSGPGQPFEGFAERNRPGSKWTGKVDVAWSMIDLPLRWRQPRRIFVNSMSDLFHPELPMEVIATIYAVMVASVLHRRHTFQVLTKRPDRMRELLALEAFWEQVNAEASALVMDLVDPHDRRSHDARAMLDEYGPDKPPPRIWLGTSVEDQDALNQRVHHLRATPAALRFLSCEPLLGPLRLDRAFDSFLRPGVDWVIAGGESGPNVRPMHPDWARGVRDQCEAAGVPFFFKQWGEWAPEPPGADHTSADHRARGARDLMLWPDLECSERIGKRRAGDILDSRQHHAYPA